MLAWLECDECLGTLTPVLIRDGDDRALHDGGMFGYSLLDFNGRNVLAARDDDILLAIAQFDVAVGMPGCDITRAERLFP
jgi:hypothetical protein